MVTRLSSLCFFNTRGTGGNCCSFGWNISPQPPNLSMWFSDNHQVSNEIRGLPMRPLMSTQFKIPNCTSLPNTNPIHCFFSPHQSPLYNILHISLIFFIIVFLIGMKTHKAFCSLLSFCQLLHPSLNNYPASTAGIQ